MKPLKLSEGVGQYEFLENEITQKRLDKEFDRLFPDVRRQRPDGSTYVKKRKKGKNRATDSK